MRRLEALLGRSAARTPDATALVDAGGPVSYAALDACANRIARGLASLGVSPKDRVGIWLEKSRAAVASMQAVLRLGAAYIPLDPKAPVERICTILRSGEVGALVTSAKGRERLLAAGGPHLRTLTTEPGGDLDWDRLATFDASAVASPEGDEHALAYVLYTSGSTGVPKGVCISHLNARAFVDWAQRELAATPRDRFANHAPFHFDLSVLDLYVAFASGASVALVPDAVAYAPARLVEFIARHEITCWYSVPSALVLMMDGGGLLDRPLPHLDKILFAGEVFPVRDLARLRAHFAHARLLNLYGPTETNVCTYFEVEALDPSCDRPVPIGRACSEDRVWAQRPNGEPTQAGEEGELFVSGPTVMLGYYGGAPQGARPYATGDLVRMRPDGAYEFVGRRDHMVKIRGNRVELGEIEAALTSAREIGEAAVAVVGSGLRARLRAYLVCRGERRPSLLDAKRLCAAKLPRYMIVDEVVYLEALPRTRNGKIDRGALAALADDDDARNPQERGEPS